MLWGMTTARFFIFLALVLIIPGIVVAGLSPDPKRAYLELMQRESFAEAARNPKPSPITSFEILDGGKWDICVPARLDRQFTVTFVVVCCRNGSCSSETHSAKLR
jgi:hypothetical protein